MSVRPSISTNNVTLAPHHLLARRHHTHAELECNLVTTGNAAYIFGTERLALQPGRLIWLFPGQPHVLLDETPQFAMLIIVFSQSLPQSHCTSATTAPLRQIDPGIIVTAPTSMPNPWMR